MSRQRVVLLGLCAALANACGGDGNRNAAGSVAASDTGGSTGAPAEAGAASTAPGAGGAGGSASKAAGSGGGSGDSTNLAGAAGAEASFAVCGNGLLETGEACDGEQLGGIGCADVGYDTGSLTCTSDCELDTSDCTGTEHCSDLKDNDGDRLFDCEDPDCSDECADPCRSPVALEDPGQLVGDLTGRGNLLNASCGQWGVSGGPEVVAEIVAENTGLLDLTLTSDFASTLSVRTECASDPSEVFCTVGGQLTTEVEQGDVLYLVVGGLEASDSGEFTLDAKTRPLSCGDAYRDPGEACDDGNTQDGDGCSADCVVESTESNNNDRLPQADPYEEPFIGEISPAGDEDYIEFAVTESSTSVVAATYDLGDGACSLGLLDAELEILDGDGNSLAFDDDGGVRYCDKVLLADLAPGTYYVRVAASSAGWTPTFPYRLTLDLDVCGNGRVSEAEACDDGNLVAEDGCSPTCTLE